MGSIFQVAGVGCSLMDYVYTPVRFDCSAFSRFRSRRDGDGGLSVGKLVFRSDLERFSGRLLEEIVTEIIEENPAAKRLSNLGGPSIVSLIAAAQLVVPGVAEIAFHGARGDDGTGRDLAAIIGRTPVRQDGYRIADGPTPTTTVLSDPSHDGGHGERSFVNDVGAAGSYDGNAISAEVWNADLVAFGGTALVPRIHRSLGTLLHRARNAGAYTIVNTVYDFLNEQRNPLSRWPLGESDESYRWIDLLITDLEEARRMSGEHSGESALAFFLDRGVGAAMITSGSADVLIAHSTGDGIAAGRRLPVSMRIRDELSRGALHGDTTGCGDNFAGGVIASVTMQLADGAPREEIDLAAAAALGVVAGGFACSYVGGTYLEPEPLARKRAMAPYIHGYREQLSAAAHPLASQISASLEHFVVSGDSGR